MNIGPTPIPHFVAFPKSPEKVVLSVHLRTMNGMEPVKGLI